MECDSDCGSAARDAGERQPKRLSVLIVEDHDEMASTTALMLRLWGHEVRVALDGPAALQATQDRLPDVVLLDIGLPGLDGYEVARWIREQPQEKRPLIVAITGFGQEADRRRSAESGIDLHLVKPVDATQLQELLTRFQTVIT